jgi:uncharacterized membrane protein
MCPFFRWPEIRSLSVLLLHLLDLFLQLAFLVERLELVDRVHLVVLLAGLDRVVGVEERLEAGVAVVLVLLVVELRLDVAGDERGIEQWGVRVLR